MKYVNKTFLVGDVHDITIRKNNVVNMVVATHSSYKDRAGVTQNKTQLHNVVCFAKMAMAVKEHSIGKGDRIMLEGHNTTNERSDCYGSVTSKTEIVCNNIGVLPNISGNNSRYNYSPESTQIQKFNNG